MRFKRPVPMLAVVVATGCQAIWGDYQIDDSALRNVPEADTCTEKGYRCDGSTLLLCFEPPSHWTHLADCEAGQECSVEQGRCLSPGAGGSAGTSGAASSVGGSAPLGGSPNARGGSANGGTPAAGGSASGGETTVNGGATAAGGTTGGECGADGCEPTTPIDSCPTDPQKTEPGACGCGVVDTLECAVLRAALAQRFSFDGTGTTLQNSAGTGNGVLLNTALIGTGALELAGTTSDQYADLPSGIVSSLVNATFEVWLTWRGGAAWQRVFDFGSNQNAEGTQGVGATYLFLTPMAANTTGFVRVAFTTAGNGAETKLDATRALTVGAVSHVAVVVDDDKNLLSLYLDGALSGSVAFTSQLALLSDVNNWLGRSQFSTDPELNASLDEFRIYRAALTAAQIGASFAAGPNPAFLQR
jgi:hypothetical protein